MCIKEASRVVEFDLVELGQAAELLFSLTKRVVDLFNDRTDRDGFVCCVLPEVAHQATPGALLVCQENGEAVDKLALGR